MEMVVHAFRTYPTGFSSALQGLFKEIMWQRKTELCSPVWNLLKVINVTSSPMANNSVEPPEVSTNLGHGDY